MFISVPRGSAVVAVAVDSRFEITKIDETIKHTTHHTKHEPTLDVMTVALSSTEADDDSDVVAAPPPLILPTQNIHIRIERDFNEYKSSKRYQRGRARAVLRSMRRVATTYSHRMPSLSLSASSSSTSTTSMQQSMLCCRAKM